MSAENCEEVFVAIPVSFNRQGYDPCLNLYPLKTFGRAVSGRASIGGDIRPSIHRPRSLPADILLALLALLGRSLAASRICRLTDQVVIQLLTTDILAL